MNKNKTYLAEGDASFTGMVNVMAGVCGASSSLCAASFYRKSAKHNFRGTRTANGHT